MSEVCPDIEPYKVLALFNQLRAALQFLEASHAQGDLAWRAGLIDVARGAFLHAGKLLGQIPPLSPPDRRLVHDQMAQFRSHSAFVESDVRTILARQFQS